MIFAIFTKVCRVFLTIFCCDFLLSLHIRGHFGDESFQAIICTGTDKQTTNQTKNIVTLSTINIHKKTQKSLVSVYNKNGGDHGLAPTGGRFTGQGWSAAGRHHGTPVMADETIAGDILKW